MEDPSHPQPVSMSSNADVKDLEEKRLKKEAYKLIRNRMNLAVGCEEMTRIVKDILVPEFLSLVHTMLKAGYRAEVVAFDAENPIYIDEMCEIGMKFRCGDRDTPCKIEFIADPSTFEFAISIRDPEGKETNLTWSFSATIPRNLRKLVLKFIDEHFLDTGYKPKFNDFDQFDENLEGPFTIEIEEKEGKRSEVAKIETMEEAIKMGISFAKMFKGKPLYIVDKQGDIVC